jgi:hypothetical protein
MLGIGAHAVIGEKQHWGEGRRRKEAEDEREHRTSNIQHSTSTAAKPIPSKSRK